MKSFLTLSLIVSFFTFAASSVWAGYDVEMNPLRFQFVTSDGAPVSGVKLQLNGNYLQEYAIPVLWSGAFAGWMQDTKSAFKLSGVSDDKGTIDFVARASSSSRWRSYFTLVPHDLSIEIPICDGTKTFSLPATGGGTSQIELPDSVHIKTRFLFS